MGANHHRPRAMSREAPATGCPVSGHLGVSTGRKYCVGFDASSGGSTSGRLQARRHRWQCWVWDMPVSDRMTLDDWRQFGTGLSGLQAVERGNSLLAFRMDDRKQRIVIDRAHGRRARASSAGRSRTRPRSMRWRRGWKLPACHVTAEPQTLADARRVARPDFVSRSRRQPAGGVLRRRDRRYAVQARPHRSRASAPARSGSATPC